jgi:hypothetical protein
MVSLALVLAVVGYWQWLADRRGWPAASVPLALFSTIIGVLYFAALANALRPVAYALVTGGVLLFVIRWGAVVRALRAFPAAMPVVVGISAFGILAWLLRNAPFISWDVFSHWGMVTKEMAATHALSGPGSAVMFLDYPPGSALFAYFVMLGGFSEGAAYIAHALLVCGAALALCVRGSAWMTAVVFVFFYFAVFTFVGAGFQGLEVDHLVALLFGCALGSYYLSDDGERVWRVIPVLFVLPLVKSVGMLVALFLALAVILDQLLFTTRRVAWVVLLLIAAAPIAANASWNMHVAALRAQPTFRIDMSPASVAAALSSSTASERQRVTVTRFKGALVNEPIGPIPSVRTIPFARPVLAAPGWALLFALVVLVLLMTLWKTEWRWQFVFSVGWLGVFVFVFCFGLLAMYLFSFGEYEGTRLASFSRYLGIPLLGIWCVALAWAMAGTALPNWRGRVSRSVIVAMAVCMAALTGDEAYRLVASGPVPVPPVRREARKFTRPAIRETDQTSRVYVVAFGSQGLAGYIARYELAPRVTNRGCFGLGSPRFDGDVWTCPKTIAEVEQLFREYDYVLLGAVDDKFWEEFGVLFGKERQSSLFAVDQKDGFRLVPQ